MDQNGSDGGSIKQRIEEVVLELIDLRDHLSFSQLWRILADAIPLRLSGTLLLTLGVLVGSSFSLGWQGHRILNPCESYPPKKQTSAEEAVFQYYALLSSGQHSKAWKMLATKGPYDKWIDFWSEVENVSVLEWVTSNETTNQAIVQVRLKYFMKSGKVVIERKRLYLARDSGEEPWKIGRSELLGAR